MFYQVYDPRHTIPVSQRDVIPTIYHSKITLAQYHTNQAVSQISNHIKTIVNPKIFQYNIPAIQNSKQQL
jgi:hypothetical protein